MEYFKAIKTTKGATLRYRSLAKKWHPDRNDSVNATSVMAEINKQYREVLVRLTTKDSSEREVGTQDTSNSFCQTCDASEEAGGSSPMNESLNKVDLQVAKKRRISRISRLMADAFISDDDLDAVGTQAEAILKTAATRLIAKGITAIKQWKAGP